MHILTAFIWPRIQQTHSDKPTVTNISGAERFSLWSHVNPESRQSITYRNSDQNLSLRLSTAPLRISIHEAVSQRQWKRRWQRLPSVGSLMSAILTRLARCYIQASPLLSQSQASPLLVWWPGSTRGQATHASSNWVDGERALPRGTAGK